MKNIKLLIFALATLLGFGTFIGLGQVRASSTPSTTSHHASSHESMSHCQSVCLPIVSQEIRGSLLERDDEPNPLPFWAEYSSFNAAWWYALLAVFLALLFSIFRPPDLVLQNSNWRK